MAFIESMGKASPIFLAYILGRIDGLVGNVKWYIEKVEYDAIAGTFNSKETGKIYTTILRRKIKPYSCVVWDEAGNYSLDKNSEPEVKHE